MKNIASLIVFLVLTGCAASMWNEHHGEVQLPLYTASSISPEYELTGNDVKITHVVDDFGAIRWDAEIREGSYKATYVGSYKCSGSSTYEGLIKRVTCIKN